MVWGMAANCVALCTWPARRGKWSKTWRASSSGKRPLGGIQPMSQTVEKITRPRSERRISIRLPLRVRGRDTRGFAFEEDTSSENLCRGGAAFRTRFDVAIGSNLEIRIPMQGSPSRRVENDFETQGCVVHVTDGVAEGEKLVGVRFVGPRFQRMFRSESAA